MMRGRALSVAAAAGWGACASAAATTEGASGEGEGAPALRTGMSEPHAFGPVRQVAPRA